MRSFAVVDDDEHFWSTQMKKAFWVRFAAGIATAMVSGSILGFSVYQLKEKRFADDEHSRQREERFEGLKVRMNENIEFLLTDQLLMVSAMNRLARKACNVDVSTMMESKENFRKYSPVVAVHAAHTANFGGRPASYCKSLMAPTDSVEMKMTTTLYVRFFTMYLDWHRLLPDEQQRYLSELGRDGEMRAILPNIICLLAVVIPLRFAYYAVIRLPCPMSSFRGLATLFTALLLKHSNNFPHYDSVYVPTPEDFEYISNEIQRLLKTDEVSDRKGCERG